MTARGPAFAVREGTSSLTSSHRYRSVRLQRHHMRGAAWEWAPVPGATDVVIVFPMAGSCTVDAAPVQRRGVTTAVVLHGERRATLRWSDVAHCVVVTVPQTALEELGADIRSLPWTTDDGVLVRSTRAFFHSAVERPRDETALSSYLMEKLTVEMVFGIVLEQDAASTLSEKSTSVVDRARTILLLRRGDPEFTPEALAEELHISLRQLQREFAKHGEALGSLLRRLRVELAESLLRNPEYAPLSVPDVARYAGFGSASAMRRAFAEQGLPNPLRLRAAAS
jgi:AraC-like DNA-binding protein